MNQIWPSHIRYVGLCGHPKSGKSTVAEILAREFGGVVIDDGAILRQAVPILFGIDPQEPYTQEGKAKVYDVCGRQESVRQMLGELGNWLEDRYGEYFMPERGMKIAETEFPDAPFYIFASVRKNQGHAYRAKSGIMIEIDNPLYGPSGNAFDLWDKSAVDIVIENDPRYTDLQALGDVVRSLLIDPLLNSLHN